MFKFMHTELHAFQWLLFMLANSIAVPIALAPFIGLNEVETGILIQRVFLVSGFFSIVQALIGHRLTLNEGSGSMWFGLFIILGTMAPVLGFGKDELLSALGLAVFSGGVISLILGLTGAVGWMMRWFTPAITGTFSVLLSFQLGMAYLQGMLGLTPNQVHVDVNQSLIGLLVIVVVVGITIYAKGVTRTIGLFFGILIGWIAYWMFGMLDIAHLDSENVTWLPQILPLVSFQWDVGVILTGVITGALVTSNTITAIVAMSKINGQQPAKKAFNRSSIVTGFADMAGGSLGTPGYAPFMAAASLVSVTNVRSLTPFVLGSAFMLTIGLFTPVTMFIATLPPAVACAALLATLSHMFAIGIKDYLLLAWNSRDIFVVGTSVVIGVSVFSLPPETFTALPNAIQLVMSNGMMVGLLLAILLEHVLLREGTIQQQIRRGQQSDR